MNNSAEREKLRMQIMDLIASNLSVRDKMLSFVVDSILSLFPPEVKTLGENDIYEEITSFLFKVQKEWKSQGGGDRNNFDYILLPSERRELASILTVKIPKQEPSKECFDITRNPGNDKHVERDYPTTKPGKIEPLDLTRKHYLGDIYKKVNELVDRINQEDK